MQRRVLKRVKRRLERTKNPWDDAVVDALASPISLLIWVLGLAQAVAFVNVDTYHIYNVVTLAVIASLSWFLIRMTRNAQVNLVQASLAKSEEERWDPTTLDAIGKLVRLAIGITATLIGLQEIGINISAVLAFGGIGGIAIGFAAKEVDVLPPQAGDGALHVVAVHAPATRVRRQGMDEIVVQASRR